MRYCPSDGGHTCSRMAKSLGDSTPNVRPPSLGRSSAHRVLPGSDAPAEVATGGSIPMQLVDATRSARLELQRTSDHLHRRALAHNTTTRQTRGPAVTRAVAHHRCFRVLMLRPSWRQSAVPLSCQGNSFGTSLSCDVLAGTSTAARWLTTNHAPNASAYRRLGSSAPCVLPGSSNPAELATVGPSPKNNAVSV